MKPREVVHIKEAVKVRFELETLSPSSPSLGAVVPYNAQGLVLL